MIDLSLEVVRQAYEEASTLLSGDVSLDRNRRAEVQKRVALLQELMNLLEKQNNLISESDSYKAELSEVRESGNQDEFASLLEEEVDRLSILIKQANNNLEDFLFPADPKDNKSCFLEIRAGTGGLEAALFASEMAKMYTAFATRMGWEASLSSMSETDLGGVREIILFLKGKGVYGAIKYESGVHRVQRVPQTEGAGRIHTSTITVAVLPEADEVDVNIAPNDIRIDVYRSSGAGGQHVNTTDSAVRITHLPSGIVVTCQDERSQIKNKLKAMKELRARILEQEIRKAEELRSKDRNSKIGSGDRSEKIRTYNFPQNRVTDHRVDLTLKKLDMVMAGDLIEIVDALKELGKQERTVIKELAFLV